MAKEIVKEDIAKIKKLVSDTVHYDGEVEITRMGGLTNHSYKVQLGTGELYAVRIPGDGTEDMISRSNEKVSTTLACDLGIDAALLYFGDDGSKVTEYIPNAVTMSPESMREPQRVLEVARIYKKLHNCGVDTKVPFEVFDLAASYENIIHQNHVPMFGDYDAVKASVMKVEEEIDRTCSPKKAPCHNDPLCENWVVGNGKMYLIDWEYAGMNDPMWDLADISIEAVYGKEQDTALLCEYLDGAELTTLDWKRFTANKIYVDFLWTLWAKTRVPFDGQPMEDWAAERYDRLKQNITVYETL